MKDKYTRQLMMKKAGLSVLRTKSLFRSPGKLVFDDMPSLERHARNIECATDKASPWKHKGWFTDEHGEGSLVPVICQIGKLWFSGYTNDDDATIGCIVLDDSPDCDRRAAINNADSIAQREAEKEREYNEQWQKGREIEERIAENLICAREAYANARDWIKGLRDSKLSPDLCRKLKAEIKREWTVARQFLENVRDDRAELKNYPA